MTDQHTISSDEDGKRVRADRWVLFSGGHDSLVATHLAMSMGLADAVLHVDTRTGIPENQDFVREFCDEHDYPLRVVRSPITLYEFATGFEDHGPWGFPGPAMHNVAYRWLKERPLRKVAKESDGKPIFQTGVRKHETDRRFRNVKGQVVTDRFEFRAPIAAYTKTDVEDYIDRHNLARNPVVEPIHRSGECFCGAYAARDEELIDLRANYPKHADWLERMEKRVQGKIGTDEDYCFWGHGGESMERLRGLKAENDDAQMMLCRDCFRGAVKGGEAPDEMTVR